MDVGADELREAPQLVERHLLEPDAALERVAHDAPDDLVGLAERQALAHEIIGEIGGRREVLAGGGPHALGAEGERGQHGRQHAEDGQQGVDGVEERLLVLLHVGVVGQRQALHRRQHGHQVAVETAALAAHQLGHVGVLLLRHDRRAGGPGVRELHEAELGRGPQREVGGQPREMHAGDGGGGQVLQHVVAVADGIQAVGAHRREAEVARQRLAVDGERGAGQGGRAQRQHVGPRVAAGEALAVALEHENVGQQVMGEDDRLRALQVRVARHRRVHRLRRSRQQRLLRAAQPGHRLGHDVLEVETLVQRDLVVARATGVELAADVPHQLDEPPLDVGVDVLQLGPEAEGAGVQLAAHRLQSLHQRVGLGGGEQAGAGQRARPRDAAGDVVGPQPLIERERAGEALGGGIGGLAEAPAPGLAHGSSAAMSSMIRCVMLERTRRP